MIALIYNDFWMSSIDTQRWTVVALRCFASRRCGLRVPCSRDPWLRARPLQSCNYEYCSWHNGFDSDKCLELVSEDEGYNEAMTPLSIGEWRKFFAISLRQRVDAPTFRRLVNTLYGRSPQPGRDIVGALIEQRNKKNVLDPRMVLYIENLLHLRKVDLADVLSSLFEPFETELRDARGIPCNLSKSGTSFETVVLQTLSTEISEGRSPETREEAILVLRCLLHWIAVHRNYSQDANSDLSEVLYTTWEALGLLVAELGNNVIVSELLRRGLPAGARSLCGVLNNREIKAHVTNQISNARSFTLFPRS